MAGLFSNSGDPDQILHFAASDVGLHCLPVILYGVSGLNWVMELCETTLKLLFST